MPDPNWTARCRLDGLPAKNWKRREGVTMDGTLAECLERWLALPHHQQINCSLSVEGAGVWEPERMAAFVQRHSLPPQMAARVQANAETYMAVLVGAHAERPRDHTSFNDAAAHCEAPAGRK